MPQIEIMQSDLPHTLYNTRKDKRTGKAKNENFVFNPNDRAIKLQEEAYQRALERKKEREKGNYQSVNELFKK